MEESESHGITRRQAIEGFLIGGAMVGSGLLGWGLHSFRDMLRTSDRVPQREYRLESLTSSRERVPKAIARSISRYDGLPGIPTGLLATRRDNDVDMAVEYRLTDDRLPDSTFVDIATDVPFRSSEYKRMVGALQEKKEKKQAVRFYGSYIREAYEDFLPNRLGMIRSDSIEDTPQVPDSLAARLNEVLQQKRQEGGDSVVSEQVNEAFESFDTSTIYRQLVTVAVPESEDVDSGPFTVYSFR